MTRKGPSIPLRLGPLEHQVLYALITGQDKDVPAWLRQHTVCAASASLFPEPPRFVPAVGDDRLRDNLRRVIEYARSRDAETCYQVLIRWFDQGGEGPGPEEPQRL